MESLALGPPLFSQFLPLNKLPCLQQGGWSEHHFHSLCLTGVVVVVLQCQWSQCTSDPGGWGHCRDLQLGCSNPPRCAQVPLPDWWVWWLWMVSTGYPWGAKLLRPWDTFSFYGSWGTFQEILNVPTSVWLTFYLTVIYVPRTLDSFSCQPKQINEIRSQIQAWCGSCTWEAKARLQVLGQLG